MSTPVNMEEGGGQKYPKSCQRSSGIFRVLSNCFALSMISLKVNIILNASFIKNSLSLSSKIEKLLCQYWPWSWFQRILRYSMQMNNAIKFVVWTSVARFFSICVLITSWEMLQNGYQNVQKTIKMSNLRTNGEYFKGFKIPNPPLKMKCNNEISSFINQML